MEAPEIHLARRIVNRFKLSPPVDIKSIVIGYAELVFANIPVSNVDGICLNLKILGRSPKIVVNSNNPKTRLRFTLAHELGHVLIPWHLGTIIDNIDLPESASSANHWQMEREANIFAAEVLMPFNWVDGLLDDSDNLAKIHMQIAQDCETSPLAAAIRLSGFLVEGVAYACEHNGIVRFSGRSENTVAPALGWGTTFPEHPYEYADAHHSVKYGEARLHWWILPSQIPIEIDDERSWREILDSILENICNSSESARKLKQSINGVAAFANSAAKRNANYSAESVASACIQRFQDREQYLEFVNHPDFKAYVLKRAAAFFE